MAPRKKSKFEETLEAAPSTINLAPRPISNPAGGTGTTPAREAELFNQQPTPDPVVLLDEAGRPSGVDFGNRTLLGLSREDVAASTEEGVISAEQRAQIEQGARLGEQVGQLGAIPELTPTPVDVGQLAGQATAGLISPAIAGGTAGLGAGILSGGKGVGGLSTGKLGAVGAAAGVLSGISSSMISERKGQRRDNTNAQKRTLDEGKQTLADWVTLTKEDPSNKEKYLANFNTQLTQIKQSHLQMKVDTNADLLKFETAVPDLAEFDEFYGSGGERDFLVEEMKLALLTPSPTEIEIIQLEERRKVRRQARA